MAQYAFGVGTLYATRTDTANNTPITIGELQEVTLDVSFNSKELYGRKQFPVALARGQGKVTGKAKFARINGLVYNSIFFGLSSASGDNLIIEDEAGSIGTGPYTKTVAQSALYAEDFGVKYADTDAPLTLVTNLTAAGQYTVTNGVYTFHSGDSGVDILISYSYTPASPVGTKTVLTNTLTGSPPTFKISLQNTYQNQILQIILHQCVSSKLSMASKLEDFTMHDFDFQAFADSNNKVITIKTEE